MEQINVRARTIIILVVTALLALAYARNDVKLGQDLKGGTILRFSLDIDRAIESGRIPSDVDRTQFVADTVLVIEDRINKFGLANTTLTPVGEDKFEISMPAGVEGSTDAIVDVVTALGDLQFRIEVLPDSRYREQNGRFRSRLWNKSDEEFDDYKASETKLWRDARDQDRNYVPTLPNVYVALIEGREGNSPRDFMVLETPPIGPDGGRSEEDFDGRILKNPRVGAKESGEPVVVFDVKTEYQNVFGIWTEKNIKMPMAILLNGEVTGGGAAPVIQSKLTDSVQISLGATDWGAAEQRAKELTTVLQTGSLKIRPTLESRNKIGASLAGQSRDRGILAVIVAFILVLIFMVIYYQGAGLVADVALLLNLVLLVGFLAFFKAVLTLPGIAGIVLTIGMAVDANILINERIREERRLGRSVRRALSEGYGKALSAIIDANVTSIITAIFLYAYGSGPVRGFAITLALGLLVSMFTAIYVTRTIFEWRLKNGGLQKLGTHGNPNPPAISWVSMRRIFVPISVLLVTAGLIIFFFTDKYTLYDVDFTGGYKVQAAFNEETSPDEVKTLLAQAEGAEVEVTEIDFDDAGERTSTKRMVPIGPFPNAEVLAVGGANRVAEIKVQRLFESTPTDLREESQAKAFEAYIRQLFEGRLLPNWLVKPAKGFTAPEDAAANVKSFSGGVHLGMALVDSTNIVTADTLQTLLQTKMPYVEYVGNRRTRKDPAEMTGLDRRVLVEQRADAGTRAKVFDVYILSTLNDNAAERDAKRLEVGIAEYLGSSGFKTDLAEVAGPAATEEALDGVALSAAFPSQDQIGSSVAQRLKNDALLALFLALVGIIIYIALRFNSRAMGFAAVLCLFHDVAITLGLVAVANQLGIVDAKINLAMVAAFLTLVGYSVNDTVVIFDRVREERGKRLRITPKIIDLAINLTLARTIRTSLTFLIVCLCLFGFNYGQRNVLEGFSFLLILGSIIGTYSTIAISSPLLLYLPWLWKKIEHFAPNGKLLGKIASNPATLLLTPVAALLWLVWAVGFGLVAFVIGLALFVPWSQSEEALEEGIKAQAIGAHTAD